MRDIIAGTYNGEITYCTVNCWNEDDCPYAKDGICHIDDPVADCSEFNMFFSTWQEWEDA